MIAPREHREGGAATSEVRAIIEAFDDAVRRGERCALATVVSVDGSSYRRPGARMLIRDDGSSVGTISAGCLERDVAEHARQAMRRGVPALVEYETASTDNEVAWGLGIGCGGTVRVLVEPLTSDSLYLAALQRVHADATADMRLVVVTVFGVEGAERPRCGCERVEPGARVIIDATGGITQQRMSAEMASEVAHKVASVRRTAATADRVETRRGTRLDVLIEALEPPVPVVIFGAGPDVVPLVRLARELGWRVEVVDPQAHPATGLRFPLADRVTLARPDEVGARVVVTGKTMALVMTHNYTHDRAMLGFLLDSPARYIGVMGPGHRTERMLRELADARPGHRLGEESLRRLHAPVGLDIGADGPLEIALSIMAEMRAVASGRQGAMLRARLGAIHARGEIRGMGDRVGELTTASSA